MLQQITPEARVFTIDTGVLFPETYATWRELEQKTGVKVEVHDAHSAEARRGARATAAAPTRWRALERALDGLDAWVTGLRREQSPTRADAASPSGTSRTACGSSTRWRDWSEKDVWNYIAEHDLPYNPLHDQGYSSIGCAPCTLPGSGREGRWAGSEKTECGLHVVEG